MAENLKIDQQQYDEIQATINLLSIFIARRGTEEEKARFFTDRSTGDTNLRVGHCPVTVDGKVVQGLTDVEFTSAQVTDETLQRFADYLNEHYPSADGKPAVMLGNYKQTTEGQVKNHELDGFSDLIIDSAVIQDITARRAQVEEVAYLLDGSAARKELDAKLWEQGIDPASVHIGTGSGIGPFKENAVLTFRVNGGMPTEDQQFRITNALIATGIMTEEQASGQTNGLNNISESHGSLMYITNAATAGRALNALEAAGQEKEQAQQQQTQVAPNHLDIAQLGDFSPSSVGDGGHTAGMGFHC